MSDRQELLRPAKGWFIILSTIIAVVINFIPIGKLVWRPDILAIVLLYWSIYQPAKLSFFWIFFLGLVMDVHYGTLLGQFALSYIVICAVAVAVARRIMWFDLLGQMLHVLPLFLLLHVMGVLFAWMQGGVNFSWLVLGAPVFETLLWPVVTVLLLRPQKSISDENQLS